MQTVRATITTDFNRILGYQTCISLVEVVEFGAVTITPLIVADITWTPSGDKELITIYPDTGRLLKLVASPNAGNGNKIVQMDGIRQVRKSLDYIAYLLGDNTPRDVAELRELNGGKLAPYAIVHPLKPEHPNHKRYIRAFGRALHMIAKLQSIKGC